MTTTQRLLRDLALATQRLTHGHVVEYVAAATDGNGRLYAKQSCAQHLPKPVRAFVYAPTHQEVDMAGAHYELIRRYVNSNSLPHIDSLRASLVEIWGEDMIVETENIIKMFPVRVINAGAPATLRFLQKHHLAVAGFVSSVAFDLDAAKVACAADVLRLCPELQTSYTNRYFYACEYLETQVMNRFVKAIQLRYRCASIIWLHDGVWLDVVVSSADITTAEQEAIADVLPHSTHTERLFRTRSLQTEHSKACELFSNLPPVSYIFPEHPVPPILRTSRKKPCAAFHDLRHHESHEEVYQSVSCTHATHEPAVCRLKGLWPSEVVHWCHLFVLSAVLRVPFCLALLCTCHGDSLRYEWTGQLWPRHFSVWCPR